jgi:hypothetical protein
MVAERVAIKPIVIEIVQTVEILRCKLVVSELVVAKLIVSELVPSAVQLIVGGKRVVRNTVTGNSPSISVTVTEIVASKVMTAASHGVASKSMSMKAASRKAVTTPPMTHVGPATMTAASAVKAAKSAEPTASATMKPTASTVKAASTPTTMPTAATTMPTAATPMGECRAVRHDTKRANRNARCQNTYCFLLHGAFPTRSSTVGGGACDHRRHLRLHLTTVSAASFQMSECRIIIFGSRLRRTKKSPDRHAGPRGDVRS